MNSFYNYFVENECNILIPSLQRDYVQGGRNDIISTFIYEIYSALKDKQNSLELNYIYGYTYENKGFVAIDGQQRLITLWLVYLFLEITQNPQNSFKFPKLIFESREFANTFSEELRNEAIKNNKDLLSRTLKLSEANWFIPSWCEDITVQNMINTWEYIKSTFNTTSQELIPLENYDNIRFCFLDLLKNNNSQIIKDDIYIKMNGRGKPLSYFDNLKAYLDDKLSKLVRLDNEDKLDENFLSDWRYKIDNEWIDFIWSNRNITQAKHQNIDDEQTRLFYNLLLIYWLQDDRLQKHIESLLNTESPKINKGNIASYLKIKGEEIENSVIAKELSIKIIDELKKVDNTIPITWIDLLDLFNKDVFIFIKSSLNNFVVETQSNNIDIISIINDINLGIILDKLSDKEQKCVKLFEKEDENITNFYRIAMQDKFSFTNLLYLYAIINISKENCSSDNFIRYIRIIRNIVLNLDNINIVNITNIFMVLDYIISKVNSLSPSSDGKSFYDSLINLHESVGHIKNINTIRGLDRQIKEEVEKIQILSQKLPNDNENYEITIFNAENSLFLHGKIGFLYRRNDGDNGINWDSFKTKYKNFLEYFEYEKSKITDTYKYKLLKALIVLGKFKRETNTVLSDKIGTWYNLLINPSNYSIFHQILITNKDGLDDLIRTNLSEFEREEGWHQLIGNLLHYDLFLEFILNHNRLKESMKRHSRLQPSGVYKGWISLTHQDRDEVLYKAFITNPEVKFSPNENNINAKNIKDINSKNSGNHRFFMYQWDNYVIITLKDQKYLWNDDNDIYIFNRETKKWDKIEKEEFIVAMRKCNEYK